MKPPFFQRYVGIDYSGAKTPDSSLPGLRIYVAFGESQPQEIEPPAGRLKYWTRRGLAEWLAMFLSDSRPTLVGIDHGFSFPLRYFETHQLELDWSLFLDDFHRHWPTDTEHITVESVRTGLNGRGEIRFGSSRWRRLCEQRMGAKSVFHFDVPGSVAKSTHAGLPWLRFLRQYLGDSVHFWPFDGWKISADKSVLAEAYPSLWNKRFSSQNRTPDQHDAYVVAASLQQIDREGQLEKSLNPTLSEEEAKIARIEGWIIGGS